MRTGACRCMEERKSSRLIRTGATICYFTNTSMAITEQDLERATRPDGQDWLPDSSISLERSMLPLCLRAVSRFTQRRYISNQRLKAFGQDTKQCTTRYIILIRQNIPRTMRQFQK